MGSSMEVGGEQHSDGLFGGFEGKFVIGILCRFCEYSESAKLDLDAKNGGC